MAVFDYATFLSGKSGAAWLADGAHYTDVGRTTAAVENDPIASLTDEGATFHAAQATGGLQPALKLESAKWYLDHAGDYLTAGTAADWKYMHRKTASSAYICAAVRCGTVTDPDALYGLLTTQEGTSSQVGFNLSYDDRTSVLAELDSAVRLSISSGALPNLDVFDSGTGICATKHTLEGNIDAVIEIVKVSDAVSLFVNNALIFSATVPTDSAVDSYGALHIGAVPGGGNALTGRLYGAVICNASPSPADRTAIVDDMMDRCVVRPIPLIPPKNPGDYRIHTPVQRPIPHRHLNL